MVQIIYSKTVQVLLCTYNDAHGKDALKIDCVINDKLGKKMCNLNPQLKWGWYINSMFSHKQFSVVQLLFKYVYNYGDMMLYSVDSLFGIL